MLIGCLNPLQKVNIFGFGIKWEEDMSIILLNLSVLYQWGWV